MKPYRLKHKATGLYYQPVSGTYTSKTNFSKKKGKVYLSDINVFIGNKPRITCAISLSQYKQFKDIFDSLGATNTTYDKNYRIYCVENDFEKEYI